MKAEPQRQRSCIFCGGKGLSKQHVIPNWMSQIFPHTEKHPQTSTGVRAILSSASPDVVFVPRFFTKDRNGPPNQRKIKNVCVNCNGGWISEVESRAKPLLLKLMQGEDTAISKRESKEVALALAMIAVMYEFTDVERSTISIPDEHLKFIFKNKKLPHGWYVSIGRMNEFCVVRPRHVHYGYEAFSKEKLKKKVCYQATTITLGYLLVQVVTLVGFEYPVYFEKSDYYTVWPNASGIDGWKANISAKSFKDFEAISQMIPSALNYKIAAEMPILS